MKYTGSIQIFVHRKVFPLFILLFFTIAASAQDTLLQIKGETVLKTRAKGLGLNVGVKSVDWKDEPMEGVEIEVKKNGVTVAKATSGKKGKYSFQVAVSTGNQKNDYVVYYSAKGVGPKMVHINAFLPKDEYKKFPSAKYECELNIPLFSTTVTDIELIKPYAKIKWDKAKEHKFVVDPVYFKVAQGEEQKIAANADLYYTALVKKKKKQDEALAKNKAAADAKLKAAEEAKRKAEEEARLKAEAEAKAMADKKAKEEADRIAREQAEAQRLEMLKKRMADSLALAKKKKTMDENPNATTEIKEIIKPVEEVNIADLKDRYDVSETFSINVARRSLNREREKRNQEKSKNLSAKYETINTLTSLLNEVDDYDKKNKRQ